MPSTQNGMWREALAKLREVDDEVKRVEEFVATRLAAPRPGGVGPVPSRPGRAAAREFTLGTAPGVVAELRRQLEADPLQALAFTYPPECFAAGTPPERLQRACLHHHALNTARLAMFVAARHGYEPSTVNVVGVCALVHDVGLEGISPDLFAKAGPLTQAERQSLEAHSGEGADRVRSCRELDGLLRSVAPAVVRQHHERSDGSGYPDGLGAPHIHEFARLLALAEAYETMVSPRPYKPARLPYDAMATLLVEAFGKGCPARFDRAVAATFVRALALYPLGSGVRLDTGEVAQVVGSNPQSPDRPHVRVLWLPDGRPVERPWVLDLRGAAVGVAQAVPLPASRGRTQPLGS